MEKLNKRATAVFLRLIKEVNPDKPAHRFDAHDYWTHRDQGGIMAVHVEWIGTFQGHDMYSIAHYYEQNYDLMADPEMTFVKIAPDIIVPMSYSQAAFSIYQESVFQGDDGALKCRPRWQRQHADFANKWLWNIKDQQNL